MLLPNGTPTASGAQVFPGFRPANAIDEDRTAVGAYVDLEANLTEKLLASVALRGESYSDFGENVSGKFALRYDFTRQLRAARLGAERASARRRCQQQYFATTSTNFIAGVPFDITTFPVTDPVAQALGAQDARCGGVAQLLVRRGAAVRRRRLSPSMPIASTSTIASCCRRTSRRPNVREYLTSPGFIGIGGGRFFINGVDTETEGVDVVVNYPLRETAAGRFDLTLPANFNSTDVTRVPQTAQLAALNPAPPLFDRINVLTFEEGNPDEQVRAASTGAGALRRHAACHALRRGARHPAHGYRGDRWCTIVIGARRWWTSRPLRRRPTASSIAIGADNLLDEYPDEFPVRSTHRQHAVLELLAVRPLRTLPVWSHDVQVLSAAHRRSAT